MVPSPCRLHLGLGGWFGRHLDFLSWTLRICLLWCMLLGVFRFSQARGCFLLCTVAISATPGCLDLDSLQSGGLG